MTPKEIYEYALEHGLEETECLAYVDMTYIGFDDILINKKNEFILIPEMI